MEKVKESMRREVKDEMRVPPAQGKRKVCTRCVYGRHGRCTNIHSDYFDKLVANDSVCEKYLEVSSCIRLT